MGKEPSWDIKNPLSKKFFIFKKCPILMILWNFPNQPKSHPSAIFGKKHAFFMKIFGQNLKTIQKHPKEGPETQKKKFFMLSPFFRIFLQKIEFRPTVWWRVPHLDFFLKLKRLLALFLVQQFKKKGRCGVKWSTIFQKNHFLLCKKHHLNPLMGIFLILQ